MENITAEHVNQDLALNNAVNDAVILAPLKRAFEETVQEIVSLSLSLYHRHGRTDVDQVSEMLGVSLTEIIMHAYEHFRGPAFRASIVQAIVEVSTMTCS